MIYEIVSNNCDKFYTEHNIRKKFAGQIQQNRNYRFKADIQETTHIMNYINTKIDYQTSVTYKF